MPSPWGSLVTQVRLSQILDYRSYQILSMQKKITKYSEQWSLGAILFLVQDLVMVRSWNLADGSFIKGHYITQLIVIVIAALSALCLY